MPLLRTNTVSIEGQYDRFVVYVYTIHKMMTSGSEISIQKITSSLTSSLQITSSEQCQVNPSLLQLAKHE